MQLIGAAAIVTLSAAAVRGVPEFRIRYHLARLKQNSSLLIAEFLHTPRRSPERETRFRFGSEARQNVSSSDPIRHLASRLW